LKDHGIDDEWFALVVRGDSKGDGVLADCKFCWDYGFVGSIIVGLVDKQVFVIECRILPGDGDSCGAIIDLCLNIMHCNEIRADSWLEMEFVFQALLIGVIVEIDTRIEVFKAQSGVIGQVGAPFFRIGSKDVIGFRSGGIEAMGYDGMGSGEGEVDDGSIQAIIYAGGPECDQWFHAHPKRETIFITDCRSKYTPRHRCTNFWTVVVGRIQEPRFSRLLYKDILLLSIRVYWGH